MLEKEDDFVRESQRVIEGIHAKSILCAHLICNGRVLATSSTDCTLLLSAWPSMDPMYRFETKRPVIDIQQHPRKSNLFLVCSMDGSHSLIDAETFSYVQTWNEHTKYVTRVRFNTDGTLFAVASHDHHFSVYRYKEGIAEYALDFKHHFGAAVEAIAFNEQNVYVSVREDNYLYQFDTNDGFKMTKWNMNENGDDIVSFSVLDLVTWKNYMLACTDQENGHIVLYQLRPTLTPLSHFYGAKNDGYSRPRMVWTGRFFYVTSDDDHAIWVFDTHSGKCVHRLTGHSGIIRSLYHDTDRSVLVSACFDGTCRVWEK